jgi:outer membrane lipoprotein
MSFSASRCRTATRIVTTIVLGLSFLGLSGCASGVSDYSRAMVTYQGTFPELQGAPDQHRGQVAMLGGRIVETTPSVAGTEIVVLQLPLASWDKPALDQPSEGRFLIASPEFLDPAVYTKLALITVVGEVTGHEERTIGDYPYTLPVLRPIEIKQWSSSDWGGQCTGCASGGWNQQWRWWRRRFRSFILTCVARIIFYKNRC